MPALRSVRVALECGTHMESLLPSVRIPGAGARQGGPTAIEIHVGGRERGDVHEALLLREAAREAQAATDVPVPSVHVRIHSGRSHEDLYRSLKASGELEALLRRHLDHAQPHGVESWRHGLRDIPAVRSGWR